MKPWIYILTLMLLGTVGCYQNFDDEPYDDDDDEIPEGNPGCEDGDVCVDVTIGNATERTFISVRACNCNDVFTWYSMLNDDEIGPGYQLTWFDWRADCYSVVVADTAEREAWHHNVEIGEDGEDYLWVIHEDDMEDS